jgi:glyoxylase-like metal-dependent hydrolase (beta-lactamase superfamily II)
MGDIRTIDVHHLGQEHVIACFQVDDVIVDPGPESSSAAVIEALDAPPKAILLTHIHLDHAAATGALVRRWPDVEVWVHERGARHMIDPSKLIASATRLYGEHMDVLWGEMLPVPEANVRVLTGGESIDGFEVAYTPGHASHHVSYFHRDSGTVFAGDVAGVRIGSGPVLPPTPPPDIDLEAWRASLDAIEAWAPTSLAVTHFGLHGGAADHLAELRERIDQVDRLSAELDADGFERAMLETIRAGVPDDATAGHYAQGMPPSHLYAGLERYHRKKAERDAAS